MGAPYSQDLRDRVLAACGRGMTTKMVADIFSVSTALKKLGFTYKKKTIHASEQERPDVAERRDQLLPALRVHATG